MYPKEKFDMTAFGQAVKEAREGKGWSLVRKNPEPSFFCAASLKRHTTLNH